MSSTSYARNESRIVLQVTVAYAVYGRLSPEQRWVTVVNVSGGYVNFVWIVTGEQVFYRLVTGISSSNAS